jgi:hypothetical protein
LRGPRAGVRIVPGRHVQRAVEVAVPRLQGGTAVLRADPAELALGGLQLDACRPIVPGRHRRGGGVEPAGDLVRCPD